MGALECSQKISSLLMCYHKHHSTQQLRPSLDYESQFTKEVLLIACSVFCSWWLRLVSPREEVPDVLCV